MSPQSSLLPQVKELWGSEQESEYSKEDKLDDEDKDDKEGDVDNEDDQTESDEDDIYKYNIRVRKDHDEVMINAEVDDSNKGDKEITDAAKADVEKTSEVKDDPKKVDLPPTSSSLSVSSGFGDQFLKLSSDSSLVSTVKDTTDAEINSLLEVKIQSEVPHNQYSSMRSVPVTLDPNQGKKIERGGRTKDSKTSKKPSITKETPKGKAPSKGSKTDKSAFAKEPVKEPTAEVVMDDAGEYVVCDDDQPQDASEPKTTKTLNPIRLTQPPRPPTPNPNGISVRLDWNNPEGDRYPFDMFKPLTFARSPRYKGLKTKQKRRVNIPSATSAADVAATGGHRLTRPLTGGPAVVDRLNGGGQRWCATVDRCFVSTRLGSEPIIGSSVRGSGRYTWHEMVGGSSCQELAYEIPCQSRLRLRSWAGRDINVNVIMSDQKCREADVVSPPWRARLKFKKAKSAVGLLCHMFDYGIEIDRSCFSLVLLTLCRLRDMECDEVMGLVKEMRKIGFCFDRMDYVNVIRFFVRCGKGMDALESLSEMKRDGFMPDVVCYTVVLDGVISVGEYECAERLFDEMLLCGLVPDINTYNVYVNGLCKQKKFDNGIMMLSCMEEIGCKPNTVTYNMILSAIYESGEIGLANNFLAQVRRKEVMLNSRTYEIMICRMVDTDYISKALDLLEEMVEKRLLPQSATFDDVLCKLCQKGLVSKALNLLTEMLGKNVLPGCRSWEALLVESQIKHDFKEIDFSDMEITST
ncbi:pentatricopeptide repeat-containing protein [Tanacetum coccineum]